MIQQLCNIGHEHHLDAFYKVAILEASQFPYFSHLSSEESVRNLITNLPDSAQVLLTDLLPNNILVSQSTSISASGRLYPTNISFLITPQDKNLQALLETYNNKEVMVLVSLHNSSRFYGTSAQPLIMTYAEANSPVPGELKGYTITINGTGYGASKIYEDIEFNIYSRGLAFELAQQI